MFAKVQGKQRGNVINEVPEMYGMLFKCYHMQPSWKGDVECKDQKLVADCNSAASDSQSIVPHAQGLPDSLCEGKADGYHSATDCSTSVVQCVGGVSRLLECPKDEVFDNVKQGCTSPDEVVACRAADEPTESTTSSSGPKTDCEGLADGFFEKEPCSSFFLTCSGGVSRILTCPANLVFDQKWVSTPFWVPVP
ncbi:chitin binding Peritrophin-A domain protein [Cooperia oncophora]